MNSPCSVTYLARMGGGTYHHKTFHSTFLWQHTVQLVQGPWQCHRMLHVPAPLSASTGEPLCLPFSTQLLWEGSPAVQWVLQLVCFPERFIEGYSLFLCPPQYSLYKATGWTLWEQAWCWAGSTEGPGSAASHGKPAYPLSEADTQWWRLETLGIPKPICIRSLKAGHWECFWTTKAMPRTKP